MVEHADDLVDAQLKADGFTDSDMDAALERAAETLEQVKRGEQRVYSHQETLAHMRSVLHQAKAAAKKAA